MNAEEFKRDDGEAEKKMSRREFLRRSAEAAGLATIAALFGDRLANVKEVEELKGIIEGLEDWNEELGIWEADLQSRERTLKENWNECFEEKRPSQREIV